MSASISSDDEHLQSATCGFDFLFSNDIADARAHFADKDDPFHLLGAGVVAFVEAALGMEPGLVTEASALLALAEAGARKQLKSPKPRSNAHRFSPGLEFDILMADAVVLLGLAHALSESYMGYLQCMYSLNNAHSKFTKLYKTVFPNGLAAYKTPGATPTLSRKPSNSSIRSAASAPPGDGTSPISARLSPSTTKSFFARWTGGSPGSPTLTVPDANALRLREAAKLRQDGPMEDLIVAGTAFGFGLFNLVFSLLPKKIQSLVGFFGFKHDRQLALQALAVSATRKDVHSIFAGLVLMTYHGVVLLLSGYQADEAHILKQYKAIVDSIEDRYPSGALWILNRAKILRMSYDAEGAIKVLRQGLKPERPHTFAQADGLLVFELAWTLLGQMQYQEAAEMFLRITELNNWSHATYYFLAAGCYVSLGNVVKAQQLLSTIPGLMDKRKIGGKDLPTEVFIKKKLEFYKDKQGRRGGNVEDYAQSMRISVAEELGIFWNTHARIERRLALAHIQEWSSLTPPLSGPLSTAAVALDPLLQSKTITIAPGNPNSLPDLDTPDEHALRALLLGISHRTAGNYDVAKTCLKEAYEKQSEIGTSTWIPGVAIFEMAVLELKVVEGGYSQSEIRATSEGGDGGEVIHAEEAVVDVDRWEEALSSAEKKLDAASALASAGVDLSSRLGSRIEMLRDEIKVKRGMLGGVQLQL